MNAPASSLPRIEPVSLTLYDKDFDSFSQSLGASFARYGFAVVADHDLPGELVDGAIGRTKAFFALPDEVKRQYHIAGGSGQRSQRMPVPRS